MSGNLTVKKKEAIEMLMFDLKRAEERAEDKGWIDADDLEMEIIEDKIEGGFVASFPFLNHPHLSNPYLLLFPLLVLSQT